MTRPTDINKLQALDLKSYHYPLALEEWQKHVVGSGKKDQSRIVIAEVQGLAVAYAMWMLEVDTDRVILQRLGVHHEYRRFGLGRLMMGACEKFRYDNFCVEIVTTVPDVHCCPGDGDDVSVFLNKMGFEASGEIAKKWYHMYGETRDGYIFKCGKNRSS